MRGCLGLWRRPKQHRKGRQNSFKPATAKPDFWVLPVLPRLDESAVVADGRAPEAALRLSFGMSCFREYPQDRFWRTAVRNRIAEGEQRSRSVEMLGAGLSTDPMSKLGGRCPPTDRDRPGRIRPAHQVYDTPAPCRRFCASRASCWRGQDTLPPEGCAETADLRACSSRTSVQIGDDALSARCGRPDGVAP